MPDTPPSLPLGAPCLQVLREMSLAWKKNRRPTWLVLDGDVSSSWGEALLCLLDAADQTPEAPPKATFLDNMQLRWRHTATQISPTGILFFGGFHSHDERLNDCWVFDTITLGWTR